MDWFRWHNGTHSDPKWRLVARRTGQPVANVVATLDLDASQVEAIVEAMQEEAG